MEYKLSNNYESMYNNIVNKLADYIDENPIQCLVIGVSGGIDSALCLVLADEAIKRS
nr:hypothetical protein [Candidatus Korarchaeota archaeon]